MSWQYTIQVCCQIKPELDLPFMIFKKRYSCKGFTDTYCQNYNTTEVSGDSSKTLVFTLEWAL